MIIDNKPSVSNRKKAAVVADLRKHQFPPFIKTKAKKTGGDDDPVEEGESEDEEQKGSGAATLEWPSLA